MDIETVRTYVLKFGKNTIIDEFFRNMVSDLTGKPSSKSAGEAAEKMLPVFQTVVSKAKQAGKENVIISFDNKVLPYSDTAVFCLPPAISLIILDAIPAYST